METNSAVVNLNVGGTRFATSKETLSWVPDSFFSSLLSGRISSHKDDTGAIFIDRDPDLFKVILNFLRTRELDVRHLSVKALRKEAEYFGITPLVNRLTVCEELNHSSCGNVLFHGVLPKPSLETCSNSALPTDRTTAQTSAIQACTSSRSQSDFTCDNKVQIITGHNSWIAVAFAHHVVCYKVKESYGWQQVFVSPRVSECVERAAINAKVQGMAPDSKAKMVSVAFLSYIRLWSFQDEKNYSEIGTFNMDSQINAMFFIGSQLVAHGTKVKENSGVVGVWNAVSQHWQGQDVVPITSHDTAGAFLLLGGANGAIYYIDMQKFPLRLKDNDLLITELYRDHSNAAITALSVYLTPKTNLNSGNWIEVAYGTVNGSVCVVVQHPELVGQGFQLFQTFTVHQSPVYKVMLSEKHLVSVCSDNNHVRTWNVTRFRGMISTQPGSMPHASFKVLALDPVSSAALYNVGNNIGPHGEREEIQVFIQKLLPLSDVLYVRLSSNGKRIAQVRSMDGSAITCFCMHECDGSSRMGARPRRYLFTGHENGTVQIWDMTTALDLSLNTKDDKEVLYGPTQQELLDMLGQFDLSVTSNSPSDPQGASPSPVSDILERVLQPRSSHSSLTSLCSAFADATFNDVDGAAKQWSAQPSTSKQSQHNNVTINDPRSSSVATETEPPANQRFAKANNIKRRHSQVIESSSSDLQLRHNRHLSVSVINSSNPLNPPFSPVGGVPLPGLAPMEPSAPEDAPKRPEKERAPVAKKSSFRDVTVRNLEFSAPSRNPERQGPASPDDVRVGRRASQNKGAKGQVTSLLGEGEGSQGGRGGAFRNSYKSAINDSTENTNSK